MTTGGIPRPVALVTLATLAVLLVAFLTSGALALAGAPGLAFEVDGNLADAPGGPPDWDALSATTQVLTDPSGSTTEGSIVGGTKLLTSYPWPVSSSNVNAKVDLTGARLATRVDADSELILLVAATREDNNGDASATFALSQNGTSLTRGDLIIQMDWVNGGVVQAPKLRVWDGLAWSTSAAPSAALATAASNPASGAKTNDANLFVEAAVNLSDLQSSFRISCLRFTKFWVMTQESQQDTANLVDVLGTGPVDVEVNTCSTVKVRKVVSPADSSLWSMSVSSTLGGTNVQVIGDGQTTTPVLVHANGLITVAEAASGSTVLANYTTTLDCTNDAGGGAVSIARSNANRTGTFQLPPLTRATCTFTNTARTARLELRKVWRGQAGSTTLRVGTAANGSSIASLPVTGANGTTGELVVLTGTYYLSELVPTPPGAGASYTADLSCYRDLNGNTVQDTGEPSVPLGTSQSIAITTGDDMVCTFTNTHVAASGKIEARKVWSGGAGTTTLRVGTTSSGSEIASLPLAGTDGTTGERSVPIGTYYISEALPPTGGSYTPSLACFKDLDGDSVLDTGEASVTSGPAGSVAVGLNEDVVCILTNTKDAPATPVVSVDKTVVPTLTRTYDWSLLKEVSVNGGTSWSSNATITASLTQSIDYLWRLTWTRTLVNESNRVVSGTITVSNAPGKPTAIVNSVSDALVLGAPITTSVACGTVTFPYTLVAGASFQCTYVSTGPISAATPGTNVASAVVENGTTDLTYSSTTKTVDWTSATVTTVDGTASITDTQLPVLGQPAVTTSGAATSPTQSVRCDTAGRLDRANDAVLTEVTTQRQGAARATLAITCSESPRPLIDIEKATNGQDADAAPGPDLIVGTPVTWTYVVTNTGNVSLTGIRVEDSDLGTVPCPKSSLTPAESMTCTMTGAAVLGQYSNVGTVASDQEASDSDLSHYRGVTAPPPPPPPDPDCPGCTPVDDPPPAPPAAGPPPAIAPPAPPTPQVPQVLGSSAQITKVLTSANPARVGERVTFAVELTLTGDATVTGITLTDTFENGLLRFLSSSPAGCISLPAVPDPAHSQVRCALGDVSPGTAGNPGSKVLTYNFTFEALAVTDRTIDAVVANADLDGAGPAGPATIGPATAELAIVGLPTALPRAGSLDLTRFAPPWPVLVVAVALALLGGTQASRRGARTRPHRS